MAPRTKPMRRISRVGAIITILRKDLTLFSRDLLFVFLTILTIVTFVTIYWVLPDSVDETIVLGVRGDDLRSVLPLVAGDQLEGLRVVWFDDDASLRSAVEERDVEIGASFSDGFLTAVAAGQPASATIYAPPTLPEEISGSMERAVKEIAYAIAGYELPITEPDQQTVILGEDRAGDQVPLRDRLRPLYAFIVLLLESLSLATLISSEIQERTVTAILSTPARIGDIILAKGALGAAFAFTEASIVLLLIRAFGPAPLVVVTTLLLGAVMVTGIAMIAGSAGRELIGTMLLALIFMIPLAVPGIAVLFPGEAANWIRAIPSFGIVHIVYETSVNGAGWTESAPYLLALAGWCALFGLVGALVLRRRVETL